MRKLLVVTLLLLTGSSVLNAQNEIDVLRYSFTGFGGTARYMGMGGAFGAVGGDMSVLTSNPAGLGIYRRNDFTFSPSLFSQRVTSTYNGSVTDDVRSNLRIENAGIVFAGRTENTNEKGWQTLAFGITYNRYQSFQSNLLISGNSSTSQLDAWRNEAQGNGVSTLNPFGSGLAWNAFLLEYYPQDTMRYYDTIPDGNIVMQEKSVESRGGMSDISFALAGNYSEKLFIGASLSLPRVRYQEESFYSETEDSTNTAFQSFEFEQSLSTRGSGFNLRVGFIYRPVDLFRFGFSIHTPSVLRLTDEYSSLIRSKIGNVQRSASSPAGEFDYTIRTPFRAQASVAVFLGKRGIVSMDYEYIDYSEGRLRSEDYNFTQENKAVSQKYKATSNIRLGSELRFPPFLVRAGFAYYGNPYSDRVNNKTSRTILTAGAGYRSTDDSFYVDFALVNIRQKEDYYLYAPDLANAVANKWSSVNGVLTFGFRF
ncbi:MAG: outer membrane protein transport protein [Bacteroidetes bacterium]|nr:outer membrane protein transport protein [Bacteroidota bacterium]